MLVHYCNFDRKVGREVFVASVPELYLATIVEIIKKVLTTLVLLLNPRFGLNSTSWYKLVRKFNRLNRAKLVLFPNMRSPTWRQKKDVEDDVYFYDDEKIARMYKKIDAEKNPDDVNEECQFIDDYLQKMRRRVQPFRLVPEMAKNKKNGNNGKNNQKNKKDDDDVQVLPIDTAPVKLSKKEKAEAKYLKKLEKFKRKNPEIVQKAEEEYKYDPYGITELALEYSKDVVIDEDVKLFEENQYDEKEWNAIPEWMKSVTKKEARAVLATFVKMDKNTNPQERNMIRDAKHALSVFEDSKFACYFYLDYYFDGYTEKIEEKKYLGLDNLRLETNPIFHISFNMSNLVEVEEPNKLYEYLNKNLAKNKTFNVPVIGSTVKSMKKSHLNKDPSKFKENVLNWFKKKLIVPSEYDNDFFFHIQWAARYIHPSMYYLQINKRFLTKFIDFLNVLKDTILDYVGKYIDRSDLTKKEIVNLKRIRSNWIKRELGSGRCQRMFAQFIDKEAIANQLFVEYHRNQKTNELTNDQELSLSEKRDEKSKTRALNKARDQKLSPEMAKRKTSPNILEIIYDFFLYIFNYIKDLIMLPKKTNALLDRFEKLTSFDFMSVVRNPNAEDRLLLQDIKSILHGLYDLYIGNNKSAINWFSNLIVTRSNNIVSLFSKLMPYLDERGTIKPETSGLSNFAGTLFAELGLIGKSDDDLRRANVAYTHMRNQAAVGKNRFEAVQLMTSFVSKSLFSIDILDSKAVELNGYILSFIEFMKDNNGEFSTMVLKPDLLESIMAWNEQCYLINTDDGLKNVNQKLLNIYNDAYRRFVPIHATAVARSKDNLRRFEPLFVFCSGAPGSGKSTLMNNLLEIVYYLEYNEEFLPGFMFTVSSDKFFEGYCNQPVVLYPDMFTTTDIESRRQEAAAINFMMSTDPYNMPMAFGDKGAIKFTSDFIFASSNLMQSGETTNVQLGLTNNQSFGRRIDILLVRNERMIDPFTDKFQVYLKDNDDASVVKRYQSDDMDLFEIAKLCVQIRKEKKAYHNKNKLEFKTIVDKYKGYDKNADFKYKIPNKLMDKSLERELPHLQFDEEGEQAWLEQQKIAILDEFPLPPNPPPSPISSPQETESKKEGVRLESSPLGNSTEIPNDDNQEDNSSIQSLNLQDELARLFDIYPPSKHDYIKGMQPYFNMKISEIEEKVEEEFPNIIRDTSNPTTNTRTWKRAEAKRKLERNNFRLNSFQSVTKVFRWFLDNNIYEVAISMVNLFMVIFFAFCVWKVSHKLWAYLIPELKHTDPHSCSLDWNKQRKRGVPKQRVQKPAKTGSVKVGSNSTVNTSDTSKASKSSLSAETAPLLDQSRIPFGLFAIWDNTKDSDICNGFHYRGRYCFTSKHFMAKSVELQNTSFTMRFISSNKNQIDQEFEITEWFHSEEDDIAWFKLPPKLSAPVELYKYVAEMKDIPLLEVGLQLNICSFDSCARIRFDSSTVTDHGFNEEYMHCGMPIVVTNGMTLKPNTFTNGQGKSGGAYFTTFGNSQKIVAIHVGAYDDKTITCLITREYLNSFIGIQTETAKFPFEIKKVVPANMAYRAPTKSKLRVNKMGFWLHKPLYMPAKLHRHYNDEGILVDPMIEGTKKMHQVKFDAMFDRKLAKSLLKENFHTHSVDAKFKKIYTAQEVLNAIPQTTLKSVVMSTSCGWPWNKLEAGSGKTGYLNRLDDDTLEMTDVFAKKMEEINKDVLAGSQLEVYWADVLKDETRKVGKLARLFSTCPIHFLILTRMYFGGFVDYIHSTVLDHPSAVGINVHGPQWGLLYHRMNAKRGSVIAGDFSNYDGLLPKDVGLVFLDFVNDFYNDEFSYVRKELMRHVFDAVHIQGDLVYQVSDGNPSGNPLTAIYNTICNVIMCNAVMIEGLGFKFSDYVMIMYGDDNIITVNKAGIKCSHLAPYFMEMFGMKYTHFSKEENDDVDTLESISFLGRSFRKVGNWYYAPLPVETIVEATYWYKSIEADSIKILVDNYRGYQREFVHHGEKVFNEHNDLFHEAVATHLPGLVKVFKHLRRDFYSLNREILKQENPKFLSWYELFVEEANLIITPIDHFNRAEKDFSLKPEMSVFMKQPIPDNTELFNTEHSDRSTNVLRPTQPVELGDYDDANQVVLAPVERNFLGAYPELNFEGFDFDGVLNREYSLGQFAWTGDDSVGAQLGKLQFPKNLFDQPFIKDKIKDFRLFRGALRVTFRVAATRTLYGRLVCGWMPLINNDRYQTQWDNQSARNMHLKTGLPHVLLSASSADTVVLDIPFCYDKRCISIYQYSPADMATVWINVMNPLLDPMGNIATAQVFVTAQFVNAKVYMPGIVPQSAPTSVEKESVEKSKQGIISGILDATLPLASVAKAIPIVSPFATTYHSAVGHITTGLKMLGLSKPNTVATTNVGKINPFHDMNSGQGIDSGMKFAVTQDNAISTDVQVGATPYDEMNLNYFAGTPSLVRVSQLTTVNTTVTVGPQAATAYRCFLDYAIDMFRFSYGSIRFKFYITASVFHNATVVFWLGQPGSDWQNCYHRTVEVQGDTDVDFVIPYASNYPARRAEQDYQYNIYCKLLTFSVPDPAVAAPIYVNAYKAAAGDFRFGAPIDRVMTFTPECCPREDFKVNPVNVHPSFKGYAQKGFLFGEEVHSLRELMHRYTPDKMTTNNANLVPYEAYPSSARNFTALCQFYMFFRGSIRLKIVQNHERANCAIVKFSGEDAPFIQGLTQSCVTNPVLEIDIPWYQNTYFASTTPPAGTNVLSTEIKHSYDANYPGFIFRAAGDDFSTHFLRLPYNGQLVRCMFYDDYLTYTKVRYSPGP